MPDDVEMLLSALKSKSQSPATSSPAANTGGIDLDGDYLDIDTRKIKGGFRTRPYIMGDIEGLTFDILQVREYRP